LCALDRMPVATGVSGVNLIDLASMQLFSIEVDSIWGKFEFAGK
jgi:hypothetical protein